MDKATFSGPPTLAIPQAVVPGQADKTGANPSSTSSPAKPMESPRTYLQTGPRNGNLLLPSGGLAPGAGEASEMGMTVPEPRSKSGETTLATESMQHSSPEELIRQMRALGCICALETQQDLDIALGAIARTTRQDAIDILIRLGAKVSAYNHKPILLALKQATKKGDLARVHALLAIPGYSLLLIIAVSTGEQAVVHALLDTPDLNVNVQRHTGFTALMAAAERGELALLRALLAVPGIDVNIKDTRGWTAFVWASSKGHVEVIQELLQAGADAEPDYLEFLEEFNPGATKIFNRYYEQRAWMCNLSHDRLYDLLHWLSASVPGAITAGTTSTANPSATVTTTTAASLTDGTGNEIPGFHLHETCTSLFTGACDVADTEILFKTCTRLSALGKQRLLHSLALGFMRGHHCAAGDAQQLDPGIRVALQQAELWTPFLEALAASTTIQEDIDRFQGHGHTLLTQAAQSGNIKVIDILAKLRADIHLPDSKGDTALLAAAKARQWDACACLLQLGAKPNRTDRDGCSSLFHIARAFTEVSDSVQADHLASLIESLLKAGFVFDQANPDTQTRGACPTLADLLCSNPQSLAYLALFEGSEATGANPARTMQFVQAIMANTHRRRTVTTDHTTSAPATISADRA